MLRSSLKHILFTAHSTFHIQLRKKTKKELEDLLVTLGYPRGEIDPYMLKNDLVDLVEDTLARARV